MAVTLKNATVLVTGGSGFVGSHLIEELIKHKARIIATVHDNDKRSYFYTRGLNEKAITISSDISDFNRIFDIVTKYQVEYIFHLAAQPLVGTAFSNPLGTFSTNIMGTANLLESARLSGRVKGIIAASSDKAYGSLNKRAYKESDSLRGDQPYEVSKSAADLLCLSYHKTYGVPVVVTRFGNIYGEGDLHFSRLIPDIMGSIFLNKVLMIRSNGKLIRDYLYVKDVVSGYTELVKKIHKTAGNAYNFGSPETLSVLDVISRIGNILDKKIQYKILNISKNEIPYQKLDYKKVKKTIGWKPKHTLEKTILDIYQWYAAYFNSLEKI